MKSLVSSKRLQAVVGLVISAALIIWMCLAIEWRAVGAEFARLKYWPLLPITMTFATHYVLRSLRWRYLLPSEEAPLPKLFDAIMVGNMATFVLPLRAGEFMRPYMLSLGTRFSFSSCFVSVVIERFFDLAVVLLSFASMILLIDNIPSLAHQGALSLSVLAIAIFVFMIVGSFIPDIVLILSGMVLKYLPEKVRTPIMKFLSDFLHGARILKRTKNIIFVTILSGLVWFTCFLQYYFFLYMFQIEPSFLMGVSVAVLVALAVAAPSAPGFVGVYQAGCIAAFTLFGVNKEIGMAYAIITHVYQFILCVLIGAVVLLKNNIKLSELRGSPAEEAA